METKKQRKLTLVDKVLVAGMITGLAGIVGCLGAQAYLVLKEPQLLDRNRTYETYNPREREVAKEIKYLGAGSIGSLNVAGLSWLTAIYVLSNRKKENE